MCLKCKEEVTKPLAQVNLIDDDYNFFFKFFIFVTNIKKEVCGVLNFIFIFFKIWKKKNLATCYV
jgi:hypothetical protein